MYPRNPQNQSYSALINSFKHWKLSKSKRSINYYLSLYVCFVKFRIYCLWLDKNNRKNRNLHKSLLVFQIWLVGFWLSHSIFVVHGRLRRSNELIYYFYCILYYFIRPFCIDFKLYFKVIILRVWQIKSTFFSRFRLLSYWHKNFIKILVSVIKCFASYIERIFFSVGLVHAHIFPFFFFCCSHC